MEKYGFRLVWSGIMMDHDHRYGVFKLWMGIMIDFKLSQQSIMMYQYILFTGTYSYVYNLKREFTAFLIPAHSTSTGTYEHIPACARPSSES